MKMRMEIYHLWCFTDFYFEQRQSFYNCKNCKPTKIETKKFSSYINKKKYYWEINRPKLKTEKSSFRSEKIKKN
jgi:hypothetical protein